MPIKHALIKVAASEHASLVKFYTQALQPLGMKQLKTFPNGFTGFGAEAPEWWIAISEDNVNSKVHVAFGAPDRNAVDAFHAAALAAGAKDNGAPGPRPQLHPDYYAAFILDPAGNNLEAGVLHVDTEQKI